MEIAPFCVSSLCFVSHVRIFGSNVAIVGEKLSVIIDWLSLIHRINDPFDRL